MRRLPPSWLLLPPLTGVLAYAAALAWGNARGHGTAAEDSSAGMGQISPPVVSQERGAREPAAFMTREELHRQALQASEADQTKLEACTAEELRGIMQRLLKEVRKDGIHFYYPDRNLNTYLIYCATQLGRLQGADGVAWVAAHAPDQRLDAMDGWAQAAPDQAFDAIAHGNRQRPPCSMPTLIRLLQESGERDPALLRQRVDQVPWDLMLSDASFREGERSLHRYPIEIPGKLTPWMQSGAVEELRSLGFDIVNLPGRWMAENPDAALSQWLAGTGFQAANHEELLHDMLKEATGPAVLEALARLSPQDRKRVATILSQWSTDRLDDVLKALDPSEAPPSTQPGQRNGESEKEDSGK